MSNSIVILPPDAPLPDMATDEGLTETTNPAKMYLAQLPAPRSRENMGYALGRVARDIFHVEGIENAPWHDLRAKHIDLMVAMLREEGAKTNTTNQYISAMKGVSRQSFKLGLVDAGIWMRVDMVKCKKARDKKVGRALSDEEVAMLLRACRDDDNIYLGLRDSAMFALMAWAGLRIIDTQRLLISDIIDGGKFLLVHRKGGKEQRLPINPAVKKHVDRWLDLRERLGQVRPNWPIVCRVRKGGDIRGEEGISKTSYSNLLKKRVDEACVGAARPHDLRRTFATWLRDRGAPVDAIRELMGHENIDTTIGYFMDGEARAKATINSVDFEVPHAK